MNCMWMGVCVQIETKCQSMTSTQMFHWISVKWSERMRQECERADIEFRFVDWYTEDGLAREREREKCLHDAKRFSNLFLYQRWLRIVMPGGH